MTLDHSTLLSLQQELQQKKISSLELTEYYLDRISKFDSEIRAFTLVQPETCLEAARAADALMAKGDTTNIPAFNGIPIAIKALTSVKGWPGDKCSRAARGKTEVFSHDVVTALVKAGFNLIGQTASPELGALPITESALYGDTRNPWNLAHTPGGSSGGSAAAVCANLVPVAEGSDGGGSIRIPASCCGLVGLKPSRGRVFVGPILSASEISMRGVLTKNVSDTAAILDVIKTTDSAQWHVALDGESSFLQSLKHPMNKKLRIAFCLTSPLGGPVDSECKLAVEKTARLFEEAGHIVNEGAPDWGFIDQFVDDFMLYWSALMGELEAEDESQFEPHTRHLRESARNTSAVEFRRAMTRLQRTSRGIVQSWETNFDLLITPTIASLPPKVGEITDGSMEDPTVPIQRSFTMVPFTGWFNVTGQPAISLPVHMSKSGLPVGVQLIAGPWCDRLLLQIAHWVESAIDFPHWSKDLLTPTT